MTFELFLAKRYIKAKKKQVFISLNTFLSMAGVTMGVMVLTVVIAVMAGAESYMRDHILSMEPHIIVTRTFGPFKEYRKVLKTISETAEVSEAYPFVYGQVMLRSPKGISGAILKGIDPASSKRQLLSGDKVLLQERLKKSGLDSSKKLILPKIIIGKQLAEDLKVTTGDRVTMVSPRGFASPMEHVPGMRQLEVAGIFESGLYEYDKTMIYTHMEDAQQILDMKEMITGIEVWIENLYDAKAVGDRIAERSGYLYRARDWMRSNRNLFLSLKIQKVVMFIILTLIILVAAFNIASTLVMEVMEKTRDIAILKAMGATHKSIRTVFVIIGTVIGSIGTIIGTGLGFALCFLLKRYQFIDLPEKVYYFTRLPVKIEFWDVFLIMLAAMAICFFATLYPAYKAAKYHPVDGIRYG